MVLIGALDRLCTRNGRNDMPLAEEGQLMGLDGSRFRFLRVIRGSYSQNLHKTIHESHETHEGTLPTALLPTYWCSRSIACTRISLFDVMRVCRCSVFCSTVG